jgi:hypothetical protein
MKKLLFLVFFIPQALWATTRMVSPAGTNAGNCSVTVLPDDCLRGNPDGGCGHADHWVRYLQRRVGL